MRYAAAIVSSTSRTVRASQVPNPSGIHPMRARTCSGSVTGSWPSMLIVPLSGTSRLASISRSVVLPDPLGPMSAVTSPGRAVRLMSSTARTSPKARRTPLTSIPLCTPPGPGPPAMVMGRQ